MFKKVILIILLVITGIIISFYSHLHLADLIFNLFKFSTNNKIQFHGKGIIIPSPLFIILFTISFTTSVFSIIQKRDKSRFQLIQSLLIFFFSIIIFSYLKANLDLLNCTSCNDGILRIKHYKTNYNTILSIASVNSLIPYILKNKKKRAKN